MLINQIFSLQAESHNNRQQKNIMLTVLKILKDNKIIFTSNFDAYGNLYIIKGKTEFYPCYVAHVDQVHDVVKDFKLFTHNDILFAMGTKFNRWSNGFQQIGVGGDDKAGIYLCVEMLFNLSTCKVVLFKDEEVGCHGSARADISFFTDCSFIAQGDRKGSNDFITHTNGVDVCTKEFIGIIQPTLDVFNYITNRGTMTDVGELIIQGVPCCTFNVSCGYYNAHSDNEIQNIKELEVCKQLFIALDTYSYMQHAAPSNDYKDDKDFYIGPDFWLQSNIKSFKNRLL